MDKLKNHMALLDAYCVTLSENKGQEATAATEDYEKGKDVAERVDAVVTQTTYTTEVSQQRGAAAKVTKLAAKAVRLTSKALHFAGKAQTVVGDDLRRAGAKKVGRVFQHAGRVHERAARILRHRADSMVGRFTQTVVTPIVLV